MDTAPVAETKTAKWTWLTEGLLIAAAPIAAYLLALSYISGYAEYFQIPTELLSLNAITLFVVGGKILSLAMFVYLFVLFVFQFISADSPIVVRILVVLPWFVLAYVEAIFFRFRWREWRMNFIIFLVLVVELFIVPLVHRDKSSYVEKLREETRRFNAGRSLANRMFQSKRAAWVSIFGICVWFSLTLANKGGRFEAMWKTEFLVPSSAPGNVVLCTYGDYLVVAPFDKQTKEVERSFSLLKKGDDPKLLLQLQAVGPLRVKDTSAEVRPGQASLSSPPQKEKAHHPPD
jgi:hypothetical protein